MNPQLFSVLGYISVLLLPVLLLLWIWHWRSRPRRWLCYWALGLAVAIFVLAKINSVTHVNRIEEDRSEQIARAAAEIDKLRQRREAERSDDVADVRFAEDGRDDFLDKGGMDEGEAAYYEGRRVGEDTPAWKKEKVGRKMKSDDSLMNAVGGVEEKGGVDTSKIEKSLPDPIIMSAEDKDLANHLDAMNLKLAWWAIWFGFGFVLVDYLRRFCSYEDAYFPLPVPASWSQAFCQSPVISVRAEPPRREMVDELAMLIRQGANFICLTDDDTLSGSVPDVFFRLPFNRIPVEVLPVGFDGVPLSPDFVFEELWFGRTAFVETDPGRTYRILARFSALLAERRSSGAMARRPVVLVWHRHEEVPEVFKENIRILGADTGFRLFVCK